MTWLFSLAKLIFVMAVLSLLVTSAVVLTVVIKAAIEVLRERRKAKKNV